MKVTHIFKVGTMLMAIICSASIMAAEAEVHWQSPEKYTDIKSGNQSRANMLRSIDKSFTKEFAELAAKLPAGYRLVVTVTDLDLAGELDPIPSQMVHQIRVLKNIDFPRVRFDYRVLNTTGTVLSDGKDVVLKDMQYLSGISRAQSSDSFYYERRMIRDWFNKNVLPNVT
jgi:hypothetical protein